MKAMCFPKRLLTSSRLHGVVSQKIELSIFASVTTSNPANQMRWLFRVVLAFLFVGPFSDKEMFKSRSIVVHSLDEFNSGRLERNEFLAKS
jgi:hypothetical protein